MRGILVNRMRMAGTTLSFLIVICTINGQNASLTPEFAGLSSKERTRLAKKERLEAAEDVQFQRIMDEAAEHFRQRHYADALLMYKKARARRPLNVNPKVKIEDLEALIKNRSETLIPAENKDPIVPEKAALSVTEPALSPVSRPMADPINTNADQRIYRIGNALILERTIDIDERPVSFRKVQHNWGGVFYFRGATSIAQHEWANVFGDR